MSDDPKINFLFPSKANSQIEALEDRLQLIQEENHFMRYALGRCVMECHGDIARLANEALNYRAKKSPSEGDGDSGGYRQK